MVPEPDETPKKKEGEKEVPPPPPVVIPAKPDDTATLEELKAGVAELKAAQKAGEIRGMSESTAHALIERIDQFSALLVAKQTEQAKGTKKGFFDGF